MIKRYNLYLAWLLTCLGMLGSYYFSVIKNLEPCHLCWYQRIALFPLVVILGIATYRNDKGISIYTLPFAIFGLVTSLYHIAIQEIPSFEAIDICGAGPSCSEKVHIGLGFISIPMLSAVAFLILTLLLCSVFKDYREKRKGKI